MWVELLLKNMCDWLIHIISLWITPPDWFDSVLLPGWPAPHPSATSLFVLSQHVVEDVEEEVDVVLLEDQCRPEPNGLVTTSTQDDPCASEQSIGLSDRCHIISHIQKDEHHIYTDKPKHYDCTHVKQKSCLIKIIYPASSSGIYYTASSCSVLVVDMWNTDKMGGDQI